MFCSFRVYICTQKCNIQSSTYICTKSSPQRASPQQTVMPDPGHKRRYDKCAQLLQPSALPSCRHCILAALFWLSQCSTGLRFGTSATAPCRCPPCPAGKGTARQSRLPLTVHRAKQKIAHKSSQAMYFHCLLFSKSTGMPVVNPALLSIKTSLPASFL